MFMIHYTEKAQIETSKKEDIIKIMIKLAEAHEEGRSIKVALVINLVPDGWANESVC